MTSLKAHRLIWLVIASVFGLAALSKVWSPQDSVNLLRWLGVPFGWSPPLVGALAGTEILLALLLATATAWSTLRYVVLSLLTVFIVVLAILVLASDAPHCGCLDRFFNSAKPEALFGIGRNLVLMAFVLGTWSAGRAPRDESIGRAAS
jgi:hypothetical protein